MEKISIMIVDDHTLIRETWSFLLGRNERFEVAAGCGNGQQAITAAREKRPQIILLDINMAPMNGFEILKQLRKYVPASKVIGLSMYTQPTYAKKMIKQGARGYLTKNCSCKEMLDAIVEVYQGGMYICSEVKNILSEQILVGEEESGGLRHLSEREIDVINLLKDGCSSKEIANELKISCKTVEVHRHHILKKLKMKNTASLINYFVGGAL